MEPVITSTYVLICMATIFVAVVGIFAPRFVEDSVIPPPSPSEMIDIHCRKFGWSIFLGGLGMLYSALTSWEGLFSFLTAELTLFGVAYFIGLQAQVYEEELFRRRCQAVSNRYRQALMDYFAKRDQNSRRKTFDLEFMKKVEQHVPGTLLPEQVISRRIAFARCYLGLTSHCAGLGWMINNYVREGGLP